MNKTLTESMLEQQINEMRNELFNIQSVRIENENKQYIGKYFRYKNRYSDGNSWWLYSAVEAVSETRLIGWSFEKDCYGKIYICINHDVTFMAVLDNEITTQTFYTAYQNILSELNSKMKDSIGVGLKEQ